MKTNMNRIMYLSGLTLFLIYLVNANAVISFLYGNTIKQINISEVPSKDTVYYTFDELDEVGGLSEDLFVKGWAFCETNEINDEKTISLIFKSDVNCYEFTYEIQNRKDVYEFFKNSKNIKGKNNGFSGGFSTIPMKEGIYELYLYCWENEENYGLANTGKLYKKNASGSFSEYIWTSTKVNKDFTNIEQGGLANIDIIEPMEDSLLSISGWAFVNKLNCMDQKVYLKITDSNKNVIIFNTRSTDRSDVGDANKSPNYNHSGFEASIPSNELQKGEIRVQIYIENNGVVYGATKEYTHTIN